MVHRIARLVHDRVFAPAAILATSYNKDANEQMRTALRRWPECSQVRVQTLHALGYAILRRAHVHGLLPHIDMQASRQSLETAHHKLVWAAVAEARQRRMPLTVELNGLDAEDFLTYVGACKGNLAYAALRQARLPRAARKTARQAHAPAHAPWYLDLYRLYETIRLQQRLLTFDDLVMTAWEMLARHTTLLDETQRMFGCVLVDEFQDVNLAQAELLDLITAPHRNYMAIGDDDQTIYEWRGATPEHLLTFQRRYRAQVYSLSENFRSSASQLVLANQLIRHNRRRQPKVMQLTQGFEGATELIGSAHAGEMARALAAEIQAELATGTKASDIAILVRVYAQTPLLEQALAAAGVPFRVVNEENGQAKPARNAVTITSIFKAKGLEWPVVCVPNCNDGILPLARAGRVEEERRLLYVAITRARRRLLLYTITGEPLSPFLVETQTPAILAAVAGMATALKLEPAQWGAAEYAALAINARRLDLYPYFADWWTARPARKRRIAQAVLRFYATMQQAGLFRRLHLDEHDVAFWKALAGDTVRTPIIPLDMPELQTVFRDFA
jgi:superfamily I DNA/RNA helicase